MKKDAIVEEVHNIREKYVESFSNDIKAICNQVKKMQGRDGRLVVKISPKPALRKPLEMK